MTTKSSPTGMGDSLPNAEVLYRMLFENSLDGLMLTAPDGSVMDANPAACRILGRSREEIIEIGRQGVLDASNPRLAEMMAERRETGATHGELTAKRKDGTLFPVEVSSVMFHGPTGKLKTCTIIRDISERKAAEMERERLITELQVALGKIRTLSGLLPICASCRKIRDEKGAWSTLESYIIKHTDADFTHGICPECRARLYPETVPR